MAKTKSQGALEKLNKKYGIQGKTLYDNSDKGKRNNSASYTRTNESVKTKSQAALEKLNKKYGISGADTPISQQETPKPSDTTKKPTDYSSAVKYLNKKGVQGASGIMTENEWRRRKGTNGGTYQNYIDSMISKYDNEVTAPQTMESPDKKSTDASKANEVVNLIKRLEDAKNRTGEDYYKKRFQEEVDRIKSEHPNDYAFPVGAHAHGIVHEEMEAAEKEVEELTKQFNRLKSGAREANLYDSTIGAVKRGYYNMVSGKQSYEKMEGRANEAERYKELLSSDEYNTYTDNKAKQALQFVGELIGQQAYNLLDPRALGSALTAAGMAAAAGLTGPQAVLPEEIISVPAAATAGYMAGAAVNTYEVSSGHTYETLKELGVSDEVARNASRGVGFGVGVLEAMQLDELADAYVFGVTNGASDDILKVIASEIIKRTKNTASETTEEVLQDLVTIGGEEIAYRTDKGEKLYTWDDVKERLGETATTSLIGFGTMNAPATAINTTRSVINNKIKNEGGNNALDVAQAEQQTAIEQPITQPTSLEQTAMDVVSEYKNAVDENLVSFVQDAKSNSTDNRSVFRLNNVNDRMAEEIEGLTGIDAKNYGNVIKANSIRHIIKDHGVNGETDSSMADDADIARIQYVIDNYDTMELLEDKSKEYRDKNQKPAPMVKISKRVNGTYYVVEAVPDTNKHELAIVTAYKNKATEQQTRDANSPHSDARNASADVAFNNNILQNDNGVNKNKAVEQRTVDVQAPTSNVQNASADTTLSDNNISQGGNGVNSYSVQDSGNNVALTERLEAQSQNNEPLSVEDVKKATGFGEEGAKLVTELANSEGVTFSQAKSAVETAYAAGFANVESSKVNFETDTQIDAFTAGKKDWVMQNLAHRTDTNQNSVDRFYDIKGSNVNSATTKTNGSAENAPVNEDAANFDVDITENNPARMYEIMDELGLTYDEQSGIIDYKSGESYSVNSLLRDGKKLSDKQQSIKNGLNSALKKFPIYKGRVYRNIGFIAKEDFDSFILEHEKEISVTYSAFTSASKTIDGYVVEAPYLVHYEIESVDGRDVSQIGIKSEKEILFATDTTFEILSIEKNENSLTIKMKEVNQNGKGKSERTLEERGEQRQVQESSSEIEYRRTNEEIHSASDVVRGGSSTYDEVYRGTSNSDSRGIDGRSGADNKSSVRETGDAAIREGKLLGIDDNENIRTKETGDFVNNRSETGIHRDINGYGTESVGNGANNSGVQREVPSGNGRDGVLSEWGKSADGGNVLAGKGIKKDASVMETPESEKITVGMSEETIDLTNDEDLSTRIANQRGSKKYKIIRDYILETLSEQPIILSDGILAKVDRSDALHLANRSANRKIAYISKIKALVEQAKLYAVDTDVEHKKFDEFRYYQVNVKYGNEMYPVYLNVGHSKNSDGYHIYDITRKIGAIAKQKNALERVENDLRSEINSPISNRIISQKEKKSQEVLQSFGNDANSDKFQSTDDKLPMWTTKRVGDKVKPKSISEIVATIEHEFGINITTGHIRGNGVLGQYNKDNRGIRTKIANNLPVISHELGHYFERTLDIKSQLSNELIQELKSQLDAGFAANYTDEQIIREGVAEYVRRFLQNRETAAIDYPKFNDFFLKLLPSKDLARLQQLADDINAYYSLDADTGTSSIKLSEEGSIDLRTPVEKLKEKASSLYQAFADSNHAIKRFDRATGSNAYILASNAAYSDAIAGQIVTGDLTDKNGKYISSGLKTVLQGIDLNNKEEYRLFGEYLTVKHGPERLNEGMRVFADDRKNSTNWMQNRQAQLEEQYPQFKEVSERLYAFIKQFYKAWGVDTGLISETTLENWNERWKYYVPFNRVLEKGKSSFGAKRGFANQSSTIKKARGSGRDIKHPVDNIIENIVKMVSAGARNDVMRTITTSAEKLGADATFLEQVPMPLSVAKMDMTGVKDNLTTWLEESDLDADSKEKANGIVSSLDDILLQYGRGKAFGNVVTVLKNGTPQTWKINDVELLQSLTSLSPKTMDGILDAYAVLSRFMTSNITGNNIVWSIFSNLPRDIGTFFTYSKNKNVVKMVKGMGKAYINKVKRDSADPLYKEFLAMGGGKTSAYTADRNLAKDVRKKLSGRKFNPNPLDWIGFLSDTIETGPRFATYKMMRDAGMTPQEAFYEAMDITVNFRRGGRISKELNKVVPFFNASVQGLDKFRRWITAEEVTGAERKKAVRNRALSFIAVSAALAAMIYAINNGDDEKEEDYEQLSTYIKNSYWVFPTGDGKYFAVPKPREIGVLSSFFETCLEYGVGENDHAFDGFYAYASENLLPAIANDIAQVGSKGLAETGMNIIGSLGMVGVIGYLGANRDFLGRPIVSSGLQNLEKKDQYTDRTSKIAYWLGQAFNGSPEQIDYFFQQILGGWWKGQKALFPVGEKNRDWSLGVGNNYIKDNQYSTDLTNWLYDRADATSRAKKSNPDNIDKAITAKWDSNMVDFYGTYYKKAKNDSKSTAARSTRQLVLDMIREYQKGIDGEYKTSWQEAVEKVCKAKGSTEYMPSVMSAEVTDGNDRKHNLSDIQYVEYQTDYLRLYWETVEETLSNDMTMSEKANILTAAKKVAKEQATERTLNRIGAPSSKFAAKYEGISNDTIVNFLVTLDKYDEATKTGKYGTYTQEETEMAIKQLEGLSQKEKAILWQSVNTSWKASKNPFR